MAEVFELSLRFRIEPAMHLPRLLRVVSSDATITLNDVVRATSARAEPSATLSSTECQAPPGPLDRLRIAEFLLRWPFHDAPGQYPGGD
jgi:hypothetical protein